MSKNLIEYLYEFIESNKDFINDLKKHDSNALLYLKPIDYYIVNQPCGSNYYSYIKSFLLKHTYISCEQFMDIIDKNINELLELRNKLDAIPILIVTTADLIKSNSFYNLYFLNQLGKKD